MDFFCFLSLFQTSYFTNKENYSFSFVHSSMSCIMDISRPKKFETNKKNVKIIELKEQLKILDTTS